MSAATVVALLAALATAGAILLFAQYFTRGRRARPTERRLQSLTEDPTPQRRGLSWDEVRRRGPSTLPVLRDWLRAFEVYLEPRVVVVLLLGFASGLPLLLTLSTLTFWLAEAQVDKAAIGLFALVGLPYTWKFVWSPIIDRVPLPGFTRVFGRRRGWLLFVQVLTWLLLSRAPAPAAPPAAGGVEAIGRLLFGDYLFPFELTSVLLLAAMVGVLLLARRRA